MRLFIVTSVYQFMNAITVQLNDRSVKSDLLCVLDLLNETFDLEALRKEAIFENVYSWTGRIQCFKMIAKTKADKIKNTFKKVLYAAGKKLLLKDFPEINQHYDEISIGYPDFPTRLACQVLKSKDTVRTILEEGMYTYDFLTRKEGFLKRKAFQFFIGEEVISKCKKVYIYRPDMLRLGVQPMEVVQIRPELDELGPIIRKCYRHELPMIDAIDKPVIMFDQDLQDTYVTDIQCKMAECMVSQFGKENVVVKMHPRTVEVPYSERIPVYRAKCPFEILMSTIDIENKVLVSFISTASMNPKLILDAEPTVIFTLKFSGFVKTEEEMEEILKIVTRIKSIYRNPEKVIVPETMEEFENTIKKLKGELMK